MGTVAASGGGGVRVVDEAAFAMAMVMLDEWAPSADWEDGLKILRRAVQEEDVATERNG